MLNKVRFTETEGKTVKGVDFNSANAIMTFTDGTYVHIEAETDEYEGGSFLKEATPLRLDLGQFGHPYANQYHVSLGIITEEELKAINQMAKAWKEATQKDNETRERETYERLKKKFEDD